ncbi:MAG TPA: hypothetical protein VNN62_22005 [Methylomirabilota bacterium]|nr:hypothetical protein [Methylomirabilota bacterium]
MTTVVRFIEETGKVLAVVDPFQVTTHEEAASFYETVLAECIKEMSRRGIGETSPLSHVELCCSDQQR